jgi:hypothetical protein
MTRIAMPLRKYLATKNGKAFRRKLRNYIKDVGEKKCKSTKEGCPAWDYALAYEANCVLDLAMKGGCYDIDLDTSIKDETPERVFGAFLSWKSSDYANDIFGYDEDARREEVLAMFRDWCYNENGDPIEFEEYE